MKNTKKLQNLLERISDLATDPPADLLKKFLPDFPKYTKSREEKPAKALRNLVYQHAYYQEQATLRKLARLAVQKLEMYNMENMGSLHKEDLKKEDFTLFQQKVLLQYSVLCGQTLDQLFQLTCQAVLSLSSLADNLDNFYFESTDAKKMSGMEKSLLWVLNFMLYQHQAQVCKIRETLAEIGSRAWEEMQQKVNAS